jgi:hypothetical protein
MSTITQTPVATAFTLGLLTSTLAYGQTVAPEFAPWYQAVNLGGAPGVQGPYGGLLMSPESANTIILSGQANSTQAKLFEVGVVRNDLGQIVSFGCGGTSATFLANVPGQFGGIDGGLDLGPGGLLLYTTFSDNRFGQIKPGSTGPDRLTDLGTLGIAASTGTLRIVPEGFPGAGRLKIATYSGSVWYDVPFVVGTDGLLTLSNPVLTRQLSGQPEGILYVKAGNPGFAVDSVLICEYGTGIVSAYEIDANGDPIVGTRRPFVSGVSGVEGATQDPVTGDFLFSRFSAASVIAVRGFVSDACIGDIDGDGTVGAPDLAVLLGSWGQGLGSSADLNGDCAVNASDIAVLLGNWGPC